MMRNDLATISWFLLFIWIVEAAEIGSSEVNRIPTSDIPSFASAGKPFSSNSSNSSIGTTDSTAHNGHQIRNAAFPKMTDEDTTDLMRKCGNQFKSENEIIGVLQRNIEQFGAKQVVNARASTCLIVPSQSYSSACKISYTCLHYAARRNHPNIITLLVKNEAYIDPKDNDGETPLRVAIGGPGGYSAITTLIRLGASLEKAKESKNNYNQGIFDYRFKKEEKQNAIKEGQREREGSFKVLPSTELDVTPNYSSSSSWSSSYSADKAATGGYWCSAKNSVPAAYWWISFEEVGEEIVKIGFEEQYPGAQFEFFASHTTKCGNAGWKLISGTREKINEKMFPNGKRYRCYGLKITNLPSTIWGRLASLKNFHFFVRRPDGQVVTK